MSLGNRIGPTGLQKGQADDVYVNVSGDTMAGDLNVPDESYGSGWNGSTEVPTKNAVYDKIELALNTTLPATYLKLDASNDPVVGDLKLVPTSNSTTTFQIFKSDGTTNVLNVDTTNGRVGIGTVSPTEKLHISYGNQTFDVVTNPTDPSAALAGAGAGNIDNGTHYYKVAYFTATGTTEYSDNYIAVTVVDKTTNGKVTVTIPTSSNANVIGRYIYRSKIANSDPLYLLATINDNTTTSYTDNTADASLGAVGSGLNTTGGSIKFGSNYIMSVNTQNSVFGYQAGGSNTGSFNTLFGAKAGFGITSATANNLFGWHVGLAITTGTSNVGFGHLSLAILTTGGYNTSIGRESGRSNISGSQNVFIGYAAGYYETGSSKLFIDDRTRTDEATSRTSSMMYGVFNATVASQTLTINGLHGINIIPTATLHIAGISDTQQLIVKANATQTANLTEWQNSSGTVLTVVNGSGHIGIGSSTPSSAYLRIVATTLPDSTLAANDLVLTSTNPTSNQYGNHTRAVGNMTSGSTSLQITGLFNEVWLAGTNTQNWTGADAFIASRNSIEFRPSAAGTVTNAIDVYNEANISSGTLTNFYGLLSKNPIGAGTLTNNYAIYVEGQTKGATLNYAIYTNAGLNRLGDQLSIIGSSDRVQEIIKANATQTTNLTEWQNSSGTVLSQISGSGYWGISISPVSGRKVSIQATETGTSGILDGLDLVTNFTPSGSSSAQYYGARIINQFAGANTSSQFIYGVRCLSYDYSTVANNSTGGSFISIKEGSGPSGQLTGGEFIAQFDAGYTATSTISALFGGYFRVNNLGGSTTDNGIGIKIDVPQTNGRSSVVSTKTGTLVMTASGTYTGTALTPYVIKIDGTGSPNTFTWSRDGGGTWVATGVAITGSAQLLENGFSITFSATTGGVIDDSYAVTAGGKITTNYGLLISNQTPSNAGSYVTAYSIFTNSGLVHFGDTVDLASGKNLILLAGNITTDTTTGTKIGTATNQKLAFFNSTPIVQPANTVAIDTLLVNLGLRATGGVALFDTDVKMGVVGKGLYVKEGTNATMGTGTLVGGTATISTTKVTTSSRIFITDAGGGVVANIGALYISAVVNGTSFTVTSMNVLDTSNFNWLLIEPS